MKILEGIATVSVGLLAFFGMSSIKLLNFTCLTRLLVLVDFPATASFLTLEERAFLVFKKSNHANFLWDCLKTYLFFLPIYKNMTIRA